MSSNGAPRLFSHQPQDDSRVVCRRCKGGRQHRGEWCQEAAVAGLGRKNQRGTILPVQADPLRSTCTRTLPPDGGVAVIAAEGTGTR